MSSDLSLLCLLPAWNRAAIFWLQGKADLYPYEFLHIQGRFWRGERLCNLELLGETFETFFYISSSAEA